MPVIAGSARGERRASLLAPAVALLLACAVVLLARWGPDWPAQEFRAWQFAHDGLTAWTSRWYGGEALVGYSALYPILAGAFGVGTVGIAAVVLATWAASAFAPEGRVRARLFSVAIAVCLIQSLLIGQLPYLLGVAFGLLAMRFALAGGRARPVPAGVCAALCSLASPLSGASLIVAVPALTVARGWTRAAPLYAAVVGIGASALLGGATGPFSFQAKSLLGVVVFCALILALARTDARALRWFAACYLLAALAAFVVANPVGGNAARVGKLIAVPLAVRFLPFDRTARSRVVALVAAAAAIVWPSIAFGSSIARGAPDPSQRPAYYQGLLGFLRTENATQDGTDGRVEVPMLREHWEALWVARAFPIARGWERQSDMLYNGVLYHPLSPAAYHRWLADNAVTFVALADAPIDYGGRAEAKLLTHPPSYLRPVWHDRHWQVWRVLGTRPLVSGAATITASTGASLSLRFSRAGTTLVRIHASPLWHITSGAGCLGSEDGWLVASAARPGPMSIEAEPNDQLMTGSRTCPG